MGLLDLASAASAWRGYEYYKAGNVLTKIKLSETEYKGVLQGSDNKRLKCLLILNIRENLTAIVLMPKESALFANIKLHSTSQCFQEGLKIITRKFLNMRRKKNAVKKNLTKRLLLI